MQRIVTPFMRLLSLRTPLVGGAMNTVSGPALATAVTQAGGFGFWAVDARSNMTEFKRDLARVGEQLSTKAGEPLNLGLGALGWMLDQEPSLVREMLEYGVREQPGVRAVWLSVGVDLEKWIRRVRELDAERGDGRKTLLFLQVGTVEQAREAQTWEVDVIVAQGSEAGGHSWIDAPSTSALLSQVLADLPEPRPHILASGGVGTGAQVAAYLTLGAEAVAIGTWLSATEESLYPHAQKADLVKAKHGSALRTTLWDRVQGRPWPQGATGGALKNALLDDEKQGLSIAEMRDRVKKGTETGDRSRAIVWAGAGVGSVDAILPAKDVIERLNHETIDVLQNAQKLIVKE